MILDQKPLSMAEASEFVNKDQDEADMKGFIKKFTSINAKDAKELRKKIEEMDLLRVKEEHITKIIDLLPETQEDVNKIFSDASLDEDETKKILDAVKQFK